MTLSIKGKVRPRVEEVVTDPIPEVKDLEYWVAFSRISGLGPVRFRQIETRFGGLSLARKAGQFDLANAGLDDATVREIVSGRPEIDPISEMEALEKQGIGVMCLRSPEYPARIAEIYDPPTVLYIRGRCSSETDAQRSRSGDDALAGRSSSSLNMSNRCCLE